MTTAHHTPHAFGAPLTAAEMNAPLGQLDTAIVSLDTAVASIGGSIAGTVFPVVPVLYQVFRRTDLGLEFYWDGTRWLSMQVFSVQLLPNVGHGTGDLSTALAATASSGARAPLGGFHGGSDIFLTDMDLSFFIATGGTALGAAHSWTIALAGITVSGTTGSSHTIVVNSGASGTWRTAVTVINAVRAASVAMFQMSMTKVGTPGTIIAALTYSYRVIAT